jgi:hypothetical protein
MIRYFMALLRCFTKWSSFLGLHLRAARLEAAMMQNDYIKHHDGGFYVKRIRVPLDSIVREFRAGSSP